MDNKEIQAILTISLLAAYADSHKHDRERDEIRRIAEGLAQSAEVNLPSLYQDVLFKRTNIHAAAASLPSEESRQLAYEMAVGVCDADGSVSDKERAFLNELRAVLGLEEPFAQRTLEDNEALANAPLVGKTTLDAINGWGASTGTGGTPVAPRPARPAASPPSGTTPQMPPPAPVDAQDGPSAAASANQPHREAAPATVTTGQGGIDPTAATAAAGAMLGGIFGRQDESTALSVPRAPANTADAGLAAPQHESSARRPSTLSAAEIDSRILRASITNGAIELLPESLSTMAIIPLQMRLVYQIGESYGYKLDKGHIRDFLATVGIGMTSQYLEQVGRKLLSGLLGKKRSKGMFGKVGRQAVSSGMSFASTYALGHVANQYYAGGRTLSTDMLKNTYNHVLQKGQSLHTQYLPEMQAQASQLDATRIMAMVSGRA